jgi:transcriptional regulator with XRE-family HTH domain
MRQYASCVRPATYDQVLKTVARNVRNARSNLAISQEEAAHRAGMASRQWQRVEAGLGVTLKTLTAVAAALRSELSELVRR